MEKLLLKDWYNERLLKESVLENEMPDYKDVGQILGATKNSKKHVVTINFATKKGHDIKLKVKDSFFYGWLKQHGNDLKTSGVNAFLFWFLKTSKPMQNNEMLREIIDDNGNLIDSGQKGADMPNDSNSRLIGLSSTDSDKSTMQTLSKPLKSYNSWGLGYVTW